MAAHEREKPSLGTQPDYTYSHFEDSAFYELTNRVGIRLLPRRASSDSFCNVLDLATGGGKMIVQGKQEHRLLEGDTIVGVDLDEKGLRSTRERFKHAPNVHVTQGDLHALPIQDGWSQITLFGNAVHLTDAELSLTQAGRASQEGAWFLMGTAFEKDLAYPEGTGPLWSRSTALARRTLKEEGITDFGEQENPLKYNTKDLVRYAKEAGFTVLRVIKYTARMPREGIQAIFEYDEYARGANPNVDVQKTKEALVGTLDQLFPKYQKEDGAIPRTWVWIVGIKSNDEQVIEAAKKVVHAQQFPEDVEVEDIEILQEEPKAA